MLFSLYVGQGVSYGPLSLFHLVLPLYAVIEFKKGISIKSLLDSIVWPFHLFIGWVTLSSLLTNVHLNYMYFYFLGYGIFLLLWLKKDFIQEHFKVLVFFFGMLYALDLVIGALEFATPFRYPISRISSINHLFGRSYSIFGQGAECFDMHYVLSSPTGFHWNQNNYALVLLLFLPFLTYIQKDLLRNLIRTSVLLLILAAGSRLGYMVASCLVLFSVAMEYQTIRTGWLPLLFLIVIFTDGLYYFPLGSKKVKEVALVSKSVFSDRFPEHCYSHLNSDNSRKQLVFAGFELVKNHPLTGLGAGGFTNEMISRNQDSSDDSPMVVNAHNYLIELLVDFGLIVLIPLGWIALLFWKGLKNVDRSMAVVLVLYCMALLTGTIMVSSLVYFTPVYISFFLLFIFLAGQKKPSTHS